MNSENREAQLVFKETWPGKIFAVVKFLIVSFFSCYLGNLVNLFGQVIGFQIF